MKAHYLIFLLTLLGVQVSAQNVIQFIGLDSDDSAFSEGSYTVMYDDTDGIDYKGAYAPYRTIGVVRKADEVTILMKNYLIVPTLKGFMYVTQDVSEVLNNTTESEFEYETMYEYESSHSKPKFFTNKQEITKFIVSQKPKFKDAIDIDFQKISFITPNFYITTGFESMVHGGATWFNATETAHLHKLNAKLETSSINLTDYLPRRTINAILKKAVGDVYGSSEEIDENYTMPWAGRLGKYEKVYFTLIYRNNRVEILPLVLLNGNSARSFFEYGDPLADKNLLTKLKIKSSEVATKNALEFVSPDGTTRTWINKDTIRVYNQSDNRLLLEEKIPIFNKIIMSEWALGSFADKWVQEF